MRRISRRGQSTVEYLLLVSVLAIAMIVVLDLIGDPQAMVQQQAAQTAVNYGNGLTVNQSGNGLSAN